MKLGQEKVKGREKSLVEIQSAARAWTTSAIRSLGAIATKSPNHGARVAACTVLLDRGWGKAPQNHTVNGDGELRVIIRHIIENGDAQPIDAAEPAQIEHLPRSEDGDTS